jgi:general secretion pathway protein C
VTPLPFLATQQRLQRHTTTLVGLALVTAMSISLAWQTADWLRLLSTPVVASNSVDRVTPSNTLSPEISSLFGHSDNNAESPAPSTNLRLTLLGSFVHREPQRSSAIIRSAGNPAQRYGIDSEITSGVRLHAVAADHVELMRNGRRESLSFPLSDTASTGLQSTATETSSDPDEQLDEMAADDLSQLRERMDALRQQMQDSGSLSGPADLTEQPTENN